MSLGNFVIRLQLIVKRLEALVLGRRVHAGQPLMRIAERGDLVSGDHAPSYTRKEIRHRQPSSRRPALDRLNRSARAGGAPRMIPAFGQQYDGAQEKQGSGFQVQGSRTWNAERRAILAH